MIEGQQMPVFIIGHKNPDTDSICSAIAYENLKNTLFGGGYVAGRAGQDQPGDAVCAKIFQTPAPLILKMS